MPDLTMFDLTGRVAAVTGGNGGIGKGIALALAGAGAAVAIIGRNEQKNQAAVAELLARQANAIAIRLDVNERTALPGALDEIANQLGPLDILVNNAGIAIAGGALRLAAEDWDRVLETNLNSCFFLSQIAARSMVARKMGKIINIASEYSRFGNQVAPSYAASKGALIQLTKSMAIELATHNVQVNAIVPGWIDSDMTAPIKSRPFYNEILMRTPAGRFGTPAECGGAAVFLASRASDFVTGATIFVDGGYAIR
jgi:2-dehydro-3-deoxy-D-gluconate 5-dehydrogenase